MTICMVLQNQYAKLGHTIARHLKDRYSADRFCAYVISPGAADFIRTQTDIRYDPILVDHELHERFIAEPLDLSYVATFEQAYGPPHLWFSFYTDRKLMMSVGPKEESTMVIDPMYSHEDLLRIFQVRAKAIEAMLRQEKPDLVVFFTIGTLPHLILYAVAKKLGIMTLTIDTPRVGNLLCLTENFHTITGVDAKFHARMAAQPSDAAAEQARGIIDRFRNTGSLNLEYMDIVMALLPTTGGSMLKKSARSLRYLVTLSRNYWRNRHRFVYGRTDEHPLLFITYKLRERFRAWQGLDDIECQPQDGESYAFFPLQFEPELALLLFAQTFFDQIALIRIIARSLPAHMKLYVKEHPAMAFKRSKRYYDDILALPNVRLIDHRVKSFGLIKNAEMILTITGTGGWEAALMGKPVITFGDTFYNILPTVKRVHELERLPETIQILLRTFSPNEQGLVQLIASVLDDAIPCNFYHLWYENDFNVLYHSDDVRRFADLVMHKYQHPDLRYARHDTPAHL